MNLFAGFSIRCDKTMKWAVSYNNPRFDAVQMMVVRHGIVIPVEESLCILVRLRMMRWTIRQRVMKFFDDEDKEEEHGGLAEWLKE